MKNKKPLYEKIYIWIGIIAGIFAILGISVFGDTSLLNNKNESGTISNFENNEISDQSPIFTGNGDNKVIYNNYYIDSLSGSIASSESNISETETKPQFNFGQTMQHIYNNEEIIQKEIINNEENKPIYSSIYPGVSYWYVSNKVRLISATNGFRNNECSRIYYFDENEKLTFALIKDNEGEHRLYFCDDILIRYIDKDGQNHDIYQDLSDYKCEWTNLALEESYEIFNGVKNPSTCE